MAFLLGISTVLLSIGTVFALKGYWMILPFAGLELAALAVCFYLVASAAQRREVVSISESLVTVEKGRVRRGTAGGGPDWKAEFPRPWTRVELRQASHQRYPSRLWVGAYGRMVELAGFLPEDEKRGLATQLQQMVRDPKRERERRSRAGSTKTTSD
jgi:uncharacterized membrane protein